MKKVLKFLLITLVLLILFRAFLYRQLITYSVVGTRDEWVLKDAKLIEAIEKELPNGDLSAQEIVDVSNAITCRYLQFTTGQASSDPNLAFQAGKANCVGYSALFNAIANHIIRRKQVNNSLDAKHQIGKLRCCGTDLHQFFKSAFFKDHDFNQITDQRTGQIISTDPSVCDYLWINRVSCD
jgi:hypothetical protein